MLLNNLFPVLILEALDAVQRYHWYDKSNEDMNLIHADFQIGGGHFVVEFKNLYYNGPLWTIAFLRNGTFDLTGTGDAQKVMATVMAIIREFIRERNPRMISFEGKNMEQSRNKLYPRLMRMLNSEFPQFTTAPVKIGGKYTTYSAEREPDPIVVAPPEPVEQLPPMTADEWDEMEEWLAQTKRR